MSDRYKIFKEAKIVYKNEGKCKENHFVEVNEMVTIDFSDYWRVEGYGLTSYAHEVPLKLANRKKSLATIGKTYLTGVIEGKYIFQWLRKESC